MYGARIMISDLGSMTMIASKLYYTTRISCTYFLITQSAHPLVYTRSFGKVMTPTKHTGFVGKGIIQIVAGGWSFHALDYQGRVWMWGLVSLSCNEKTCILTYNMYRCNQGTHWVVLMKLLLV